MADECRIYFENVRKLGILKKFTEATAEKAIKYCRKWITIAGFRQKVCESVLDQVDAGKSLVGECYHFGWQNIRSEEKISKQFCFLLTRNQERKHLGYLKIRWQQLCFLNGKDQIRHQLDQVDLSYTNFSPELVSILVYLYILYLLSFYYHFKSFYCYHFFFIIKCSFEMFFETLLGLNTYCFIILIFKVLKIINRQINYMIIATALSKIFIFFL